MVLIASITYTTELKTIFFKLILLILNRQKLLSEELRDLRDPMPRHWSQAMPCQ